MKRGSSISKQSEERVRRVLEDRERLSRDLHDHIVQAIYAIGLNLDECRRRSSPEVAARLSDAIESLNNLMRDVRGYITGSPRRALTAAGFRSELANLLKASGSSAAFVLEISSSAIDALSPDTAEHLLHIAREALSNALRHAGASRGSVVLRATADEVLLEVKDNGAGFELAKAARKSGGLHNITTRAKQIGAKLDVASAARQGTRIVVRLIDTGPSGTPSATTADDDR